MEKYKTEIWDSVKALWAVWVPAQLINFSFVPRHLRIPYVAAVSFGWTVILSVMQGKFDTAKLAQEAGGGAAATVPAAMQLSRHATVAAAERAGNPAVPIVAAAVAEAQPGSRADRRRTATAVCPLRAVAVPARLWKLLGGCACNA